MGKKKHSKEGKVSFYEFFQRFPDEESAEKYFAEKDGERMARIDSALTVEALKQ